MIESIAKGNLGVLRAAGRQKSEFCGEAYFLAFIAVVLGPPGNCLGVGCLGRCEGRGVYIRVVLRA